VTLLSVDAPASTKKALLQALIADVQVTSREHIEPTFRVLLMPPVRNLSAVVGRAGAYSNRSIAERLARVAQVLAATTPEAAQGV
jgi:hypothetical protein